MNLTVDVVSDVICPWCYIGKRRLETAIAAVDGQHEVRVHWHPFQLNPTMPKSGISRKEYRTQKFGSWERSMELDAQVIAVGESEGIHFAFDKSERTPNTVDAHRCIWLADQQGCQDTVVEGLFRAYFIDGKDIGKRQTLIEVVAEAGLDRQAADAMLDSDDGMSVISTGREMSQRLGVTGVPFFVINHTISLSGAQAPQTFLDAFEQANP
ncbi:DSBA-like thioredoxin domain protein [Rubripirellula lacrimiformis]|uniref:DSBA-like thioredoxin domain protein n=1 Tax=Rubripirellula lacrimiformis TaxID=1930273 RepID=A0A517NBH4_9BACT|nr:DsbA family oxidoreductase [Rubripirellula lacrimiformis]QDT04482.1 DSBA-like thioredoxin domain protein [Rubripirellula lacrimiformis]